MLNQRRHNLTVAELEDRVVRLARYVPELLRTEEDKKFMFATKLGLALTGNALRKCNTFGEVVSAARRQETMSKLAAAGFYGGTAGSEIPSSIGPQNCYVCRGECHRKRNWPCDDCCSSCLLHDDE